MKPKVVGRKEIWATGASPQLVQLADTPGFLKDSKVKELFCDESLKFNLDLANEFTLICWLGLVDEIKKVIESGSAPNLTGSETPLRTPYLALVVLGSQRISSPDGRPLRHLEALKYLISAGCPLDKGDIVGYSALFHCVTNKPRLDLARILLEAGASPNHQNRCGETPLMSCIMQNRATSIDLLMEFDADLDLAEANGITPRKMLFGAGPAVRAVIQKWERKRKGEGEAAFTSKGCKSCGKIEKDQKLFLCAACRLVKYCSIACQRKDWKAHKLSCRPAEATQSITIKPSYSVPGAMFSIQDRAREMLYQATGDSYEAEPNRPGPDNKGTTLREAANIIVKVSLSLQMPGTGPMLVYNRKRTFLAIIKREENRTDRAFQKLNQVIQEKGVKLHNEGKGLKAYFQADLKDKNTLEIRIGEVLAEQPF